MVRRHDEDLPRHHANPGRSRFPPSSGWYIVVAFAQSIGKPPVSLTTRSMLAVLARRDELAHGDLALMGPTDRNAEPDAARLERARRFEAYLVVGGTAAAEAVAHGPHAACFSAMVESDRGQIWR